MRRLSLATPVLIAAGLALCAPAQAAAPASSGEKVNMVIIFGEDACPASTGNEITVCARKDEAERFRIPAPLREATTPQNDAWNNKVIAYETVGSSGAQSCSAAGSGGWTGCSVKLINDAFAEKRTSTDVQFGKMIEKEREKRLLTIDKDAAEAQSDVEQAERAYDLRKKAEADQKAAAGKPAL